MFTQPFHKELLPWVQKEIDRLWLESTTSLKTRDAMINQWAWSLEDFIVQRIVSLMEQERIPTKDMNPNQQAYSLPFWTQILNQNPDARIRLDKIRDIDYPAQPNLPIHIQPNQNPLLNTILNSLLNNWYDMLCWRFIISNFPELVTIFYKLKRDLEDQEMGDKNIVLVVNHYTLASLSILSILLWEWAKIDIQKIYTLVWPLIVSSQEGMQARRYWRIIKTWPPGTINSDTWLASARSVAGRAHLLLNSLIIGSKGNRFLVAPSGQRDRINWNEISVRIPERSEDFLNTLTQKWALLLPVGIDERGVCDSDGIPRRRWKIPVSVGQITQNAGEAIEQLIWLIPHKPGENIVRIS